MEQNLYICDTHKKNTIMDLSARKYNFIQELTTVDEILLEKLEKVLRANKKSQDWFLKLSTEEQTEIEVGLKEADNNEFVTHETVMKKFAKWH
jgi:predicted transcriptional regulator